MLWRAVIFSDVAGGTARRLIAATLAEAHRRPDFEVCGLVTANPDEMIRTTRARATSWARSLAVAATGGPRRWRPPFDLKVAGRKAVLPVLIASEGVNDTAFIERMHAELRPNVLLSYFNTQIIKAPLLESMDQAVNYHDGLLPHYGGLAATAHSVYRGDSTTGFTFHRMTTGIDDGPVLVQESIPITPGHTGNDVQAQKVVASVEVIPQVIDLIVANDPGTPQSGDGSYYSMKDFHVLSDIPDPAEVSTAEFHRRLSALGPLTITIDGIAETVSAIGEAKPGSPFSFTSADGDRLCATRIANMPARLSTWRRRLQPSRAPKRDA